MADELRAFAVTVPAGTAIATPQVTALTMPARIVLGVRIRIPPGPFGAVGFALAAAGTNIIPAGAGQWFIADNEVIDEELHGQIESGAWQLSAYNLGRWPHTLQVVFRLALVRARGAGELAAPLTIVA